MSVFLAQFFNTVVVFMLVFHSIFVTKSMLESSINGYIFIGPFAEFNNRWYLSVGSPLIFTVFIQIFTPHVGLVFSFIWRSIRRCLDRSCTFNTHKTKQASQLDYEDLYTGPEIVL